MQVLSLSRNDSTEEKKKFITAAENGCSQNSENTHKDVIRGNRVCEGRRC